MRVGIDATSVLDEETGVENHVLTVVDALARFSDHELVCFVRQRPPKAWCELDDRIEVCVLKTDSQVVATQILLPRAARRTGVDLLYCGGKPPPAIYAGPLLVGIHDAIPWEHPEYMGSRRAVMWFRSLYRRSVRSGSTVVTGSDASRQALAPVLELHPSDIHVIGNALAPWFVALVDDPGLPWPAQAPDGEYVLAVSRFDPRRGVATILDAWALLHDKRPDLKLLLAGKVGWHVNTVIERARRTPGVILTGEVDRRTLASLYRHAAAFITASVYEGFGLPVLEAMSFGAPIVASAIPPHMELASGAAEFFPPGDSPALARAAELVLGDPVVQERARQAGRARAAAFSARALAAEWTRAAAIATGESNSRHKERRPPPHGESG